MLVWLGWYSRRVNGHTVVAPSFKEPSVPENDRIDKLEASIAAIAAMIAQLAAQSAAIPATAPAAPAAPPAPKAASNEPKIPDWSGKCIGHLKGAAVGQRHPVTFSLRTAPAVFTVAGGCNVYSARAGWRESTGRGQ